MSSGGPKRAKHGRGRLASFRNWAKRKTRTASRLGFAASMLKPFASANVARRRIYEMIERYGASTVKAVMRRTMDESEALVRERIVTPSGRVIFRTRPACY